VIIGQLRRYVSRFSDINSSADSEDQAMDAARRASLAREPGFGGDRMIWIANVLVALVALLHAYFLVLEMFLWTKPQGLKTFGMSQQKATDSAVLAANQGLYNGFLAAGLVWGLVHPTAGFGFQIKTFFLLCVVVAGVYGAVTVNRRILWVQAAPAALALLALWLI
jgi:putative membrane protein